MEFINDPNYLKIESVRLDTFHTWPLNGAVSREEVARQGFYYTGYGDAVACVFCRGHLEKWVQTDVVSTEHSKWFPDCPFVLGRECGNVPRQNTNPRIPAYTFFYDRLDSFSSVGWPTTGNISVDKIASAGFFYIGYTDRVQCFNCGLKLDQWEASDSAWDEHKKYKGDSCSFVMERYNCYLSRQLVSNCVPLSPNPFRESGRPPNRVCKLPREERQSSSQNCNTEKMGVNEYSLKQTFLVSGETPRNIASGDILSESLLPQTLTLQSPPYPSPPPPPPPSSAVISQVSVAPTTSATTDPLRSIETLVTSDPTSTAQGSTSENVHNSLQLPVLLPPQRSEPEHLSSSNCATSREIENLRQKLAELENEVMCKICFEKDIEVVFKPCKHMVCCVECSKKQLECPICRTKIEEKERIYRS
ncbi:baculoviral IAP repeat-containing protein 7-B-like isoform X1 [Argonauta hians]